QRAVAAKGAAGPEEVAFDRDVGCAEQVSAGDREVPRIDGVIAQQDEIAAGDFERAAAAEGGRGRGGDRLVGADEAKAGSRVRLQGTGDRGVAADVQVPALHVDEAGEHVLRAGAERRVPAQGFDERALDVDRAVRRSGQVRAVVDGQGAASGNLQGG